MLRGLFKEREKNKWHPFFISILVNTASAYFLPHSLSYRKNNNSCKQHGLIWFYGRSTIAGYLMPNPFIRVNSSISNQFSRSTQFSSIWPIHRTLSGTTTPGPKWTWEQWQKGVLHIPQISSITCLVSLPGHSLWWGGLTPLQRCSLQPQPTWLINSWENVSCCAITDEVC